MVLYKQKCYRCKNMVLITSRSQFPACYDCQKAELHKKIKNQKMKKLFDIPEDFYRQSAFLRSIKVNYLKFDRLTEKQIEFFKKVVAEMKAEKKEKK